jgi:hypothetical protein
MNSIPLCIHISNKSKSPASGKRFPFKSVRGSWTACYYTARLVIGLAKFPGCLDELG